MVFILSSAAVELGFLQSLTLFQCPGQLWVSFFPSSFVYYSFLLLIKPLFDSWKKTEDTERLFSLWYSEFNFLASFPFILYLASSYIFILFSSCCFWRMPVAIHQQNCGCGWGFTRSKPAQAALHDPPCLFPPLHRFLLWTSENWFRLKSNPATKDSC